MLSARARTARWRLVAMGASVCCAVSLGAVAWPFSSGPQDIQVSSVSTVDFKDQPQIEWMGPDPRPSRMLTRIDFTTTTDLLALAKKHEYNVDYAAGPCNKGSVVNSVEHYGGVYWGSLRLTPYVKAAPGYAEAVAKGGKMSYQVYVLMPPKDANTTMCLTLAGGNMAGGKLRSNIAPILAKSPVDLLGAR